MKRVLVASMMHESNSFNPIIAGENDFGVVRGEKLFERNPKNDPLRGVMDTLIFVSYLRVSYQGEGGFFLYRILQKFSIE